MRLLICGGGTGGHVYPALALARYALKQDQDAQIHFVGTKRGLESRIVPGAGFSFSTISARGYQRGLKPTVLLAKELWKGAIQARRILREFDPEVVLGTGGYASVPVIVAAALERKPIVIHEQNALPGLANRLLAPLAASVCLSFEQSGPFFTRFSQTVVTGNPRASEAVASSADEGIRRLKLNPRLNTVVVYGGSQGADKINRVVTAYLKSESLPEQMQLVYITGERYYREVEKELGETAGNLRLLPYLDDLLSVLAAADLVVTRSGATTLAEITALGLPAILIPSPNVANNHQFFNARLLAGAGAALLIEENDFNPFRLKGELTRLFNQTAEREKMARSSLKLGHPEAAESLYRCLADLVDPKSKKANIIHLLGLR